MPRGAVGRNDPCPCGSGKKYKKCCQTKMEHEARQRESESGTPFPPVASVDGRPVSPSGTFFSEIDEWNNAARDFLDAGRYEEAENLAKRLVEKYPDQIDGYDIRGHLREAQGRWSDAAVAYEQALAAAQAQGPDAFHESILEELRQAAQRCRAKAESDTATPS